MGPDTHRVSLDAVRRHYQGLAADYEQHANRACLNAYRALLRAHLGRCRAVLELGAGTSDLLNALDAPLAVAVDITAAMLGARAPGRSVRVVADAAQLPFANDRFDGIISVNLLEHAPYPKDIVSEAARVLRPGGCFLAITPNGDVARLLHWIERLHLKLPEGPHHFLTRAAMAEAMASLDVLEHRRFLACPVGPPAVTRTLDRLAAGWGLFQYVVARK
ncbi:MAG TPA: methyltransferase domain-containing protein [Candidatus Hydrogenedentes bacterium]|nr:methyltransferase domain-containing protein [Candidatus Hydrogenedentota bacterium]HPG66279.1 methyltransferase domain-containing protein [Candidatus Hydrogenedentota bacterium]